MGYKDQTHFRPIDTKLSQGTRCVLLVFYLSNLESFRNLPNWIENIKTNLGKHIPMVLIGNKSDLTDRKVVHVDEGAKFVGKYNISYIEVLTKTTEGINDCFYILAFRVFKTQLIDILLKKLSL